MRSDPQHLTYLQRWRRMGIFEKLIKWMVEYYATERGGIGWRWQAMDSKNSPAPVGGAKTAKNPTDRGKRGAKINLFWSTKAVLLFQWCSPAPIAMTRSQPWT